MSAAKTFVDSNILIYAVDRDAGDRHELAKERLHQLWSDKDGVVSMQVLQEFYNCATRKLASPLSREIARRVVKQYAWWMVPMGVAELETAFAIEDAARISFWDALIVAAAVKAGAKRILTEDLHHGQTIAGVRIENPFAN
jgi:predicted nucleic acid-binding protein